MSRVRGPNSALTEFLRSQGIDANKIRRRHEKRVKQQQDGEDLSENEQTNDETEVSQLYNQKEISDDDDDDVLRIADEAANKRNQDFSADHDGTTFCANCDTRFTVTVYSKPAPNSDDKYLCRACSHSLGSKSKSTSKSSIKKRKKVATELLDMKLMTPPSLQDLCITKAAEHIDSITELGNLSTTALNKIIRILSKNRRLSSKTMQLFLLPHVTTLEFWDCSSISAETFNLIPAMCPNLQSLTLGMCGQLCGDNLVRFAEQMPNLTSIHLEGPFMVRKDSWLDFFDNISARLRSLSISSVYRVDAEVLALMASSCVNLEYLSLRSLCQMNDPSPLYLIGMTLINLRHLELSDLEYEAWSDDALVQILQSVGPQLKTLILKNPGDTLSDSTINAVSESCCSLSHLELVNCEKISDEAVQSLFDCWTEKNPDTTLKFLSLERCIKVGNNAVLSALGHSGRTLIELNVNSLKKLEPSTIELFASLPNLEKLDISFVGQVNPRQIYKLSMSKSLRQVLAFGNIRISGMPIPTGMLLLGTM